MPHHHHLEISTLLLALAPLNLVACAGETIDLGEHSSASSAPTSLCEVDTSITGTVTVANQQELNELAGCVTVGGDLLIAPFEGADFSPLASLSRVEGALDIGRAALDDDESTQTQEAVDRAFALQEAGWITSLEGFENLEAVGSLSLEGVGASSLAPLSNLRALTDGGALSIGPCVGLTDLVGLENLSGIVDLSLSCNSLTSLRGLNLPRRLGDVYIASAQLSNIDNLDSEQTGELRLEGTALENLDALHGLQIATFLSIGENPALTNADGLDGLVRVDELDIFFNEALESLPELTRLGELGSLEVFFNPLVQRFPSFPALRQSLEDYLSSQLGAAQDPTEDPLDVAAPQDLSRFIPEFVTISANTALEELTLPAGWVGARNVDISGNDSLRSVDLSTLRAVDFLALAANHSLESVDLGEVTRVSRLVVADNPALPLEPFESLQTFESTLSPGPLL